MHHPQCSQIPLFLLRESRAVVAIAFANAGVIKNTMRPVEPPSFGTKESEVQREETASIVKRPSASASGSRGTFSCRRWRLLSGKPSKDAGPLDARVSTHKPSLTAENAENVRRPTTVAVDSKHWATAATPFAAFLPCETIVPTISRKSVAAAVLTSAFPPENINTWDREMTICERNHVKAMGRMATKIYRGKSVGEDSSRRQKCRHNQTLKDQIYLPVLSQARSEGLQPSRAFKSPPPPQHIKSTQEMPSTFAIPDALTGMKLLSSQFDELRAGLDISSRAREISGTVKKLWYPQLSHRYTATQSCSAQTFNSTACKIRQPEDTDSTSSSLETLLLRVLERHPASPDGYQADEEESTIASSAGMKMKTKSLDSRSTLDSENTNNSEEDLLFLLHALDSTSQTSSQCETSTTSDLPLDSLSSGAFTASSDD